MRLLLSRRGFGTQSHIFMFKALGFLIILWGLVHFFSAAYVELDQAAAKSFHLVGTAAELAEVRLQNAEPLLPPKEL